MVIQEAHEAFTDWFSHSSSAPQKPTLAPEAKFTEQVANEMKEKEYQVCTNVMTVVLKGLLFTSWLDLSFCASDLAVCLVQSPGRPH